MYVTDCGPDGLPTGTTQCDAADATAASLGAGSRAVSRAATRWPMHILYVKYTTNDTGLRMYAQRWRAHGRL